MASIEILVMLVRYWCNLYVESKREGVEVRICGIATSDFGPLLFLEGEEPFPQMPVA